MCLRMTGQACNHVKESNSLSENSYKNSIYLMEKTNHYLNLKFFGVLDRSPAMWLCQCNLGMHALGSPPLLYKLSLYWKWQLSPVLFWQRPSAVRSQQRSSEQRSSVVLSQHKSSAVLSQHKSSAVPSQHRSSETQVISGSVATQVVGGSVATQVVGGSVATGREIRNCHNGQLPKNSRGG